MHLCFTCKHFNAGWSQGEYPAAQCQASGNLQPDYVNGGTMPIVYSAQACRSNRTLCAPQAQWFEARVKEIA